MGISAASFKKMLHGTIENVERFGLSVVTVADGPERDRFAYSVGLTATYGHPELIISGLSGSVASALINQCAKEIAAGKRYADDEKSDDVLSGSNRVVFRKVTDAFKVDLFGIAFAYYGHFDFEALQLVWPDRAGRLPAEADYEQGEDAQDFFFQDGGARKRGGDVPPDSNLSSRSADKLVLCIALGLAYLVLFVKFAKDPLHEWMAGWPSMLADLMDILFFLPVIVVVAMVIDACVKRFDSGKAQ